MKPLKFIKDPEAQSITDNIKVISALIEDMRDSFFISSFMMGNRIEDVSSFDIVLDGYKSAVDDVLTFLINFEKKKEELILKKENDKKGRTINASRTSSQL